MVAGRRYGAMWGYVAVAGVLSPPERMRVAAKAMAPMMMSAPMMMTGTPDQPIHAAFALNVERRGLHGDRADLGGVRFVRLRAVEGQVDGAGAHGHKRQCGEGPRAVNAGRLHAQRDAAHAEHARLDDRFRANDLTAAGAEEVAALDERLAGLVDREFEDVGVIGQLKAERTEILRVFGADFHDDVGVALGRALGCDDAVQESESCAAAGRTRTAQSATIASAPSADAAHRARDGNDITSPSSGGASGQSEPLYTTPKRRAGTAHCRAGATMFSTILCSFSNLSRALFTVPP